jgi:signal peptidase I
MAWARRLTILFAVLAVAMLSVFAVERLWLVPFHVPTTSMTPALKPGDTVVVDRTVDLKHLQRGDIVVFAASTSDSMLAAAGQSRKRSDEMTAFPKPGSPHSRLLVKRIVGLPGETIEAHHGALAVNDTHRIEASWLTGTDLDIPQVYLRSDEYLVIGDDHASSFDSRQFGPIPRRAIVGVVRWRIWPWSRPWSIH